MFLQHYTPLNSSSIYTGTIFCPHSLLKFDFIKMTVTSELISLDEDTEVQLFRSIKSVPDTWDQLAPVDNIFLQRTYLEVLEKFPPQDMKFAYLVFFQHKKPVGIAKTQIQLFQANQNIQEDKEGEGLLERIGSFVKEKVAENISFYTLVCGNLLLTGAHGFYFSPNLALTQQVDILYNGLNAVLPKLSTPGMHISAILLKEIEEQERDEIGLHLREYYQEFSMQPNMVFALDPGWNNFQDYVDSLSSKYRVRMKRAFKKAASIRKESMDLETILAQKDRIHELYLSVANNSDFNSAELHPDYFLELKRSFPDDFQLVGYYLDHQLIGYYTTIKNHHELEAHFLGFDYTLNTIHQTYLNILFDITRDGIAAGVEKIVFARTALEIKSSIGAEPIEMYFYARHRSKFSNRLLQSMVQYLQPKSPEWTQRHPFKATS